MKILLFLLAGIIKFGKADHVVVIGTGPPPATVGPGIPITPFNPDPRPIFANVNKVPSGFLSGEELTFSSLCSHRRVGTSWATWSHGYTGDVYYSNGATSLDIGLPISTAAFVLYVEPNPFGVYSFTVTFSGGQSITEGINGNAGAKGFAVFEHDELGSPTGVSISSTVDFAVGEFYIGMNSPPVALCKVAPEVMADANCEANVDINDGSYDTDTATDELTIVQTPQAPYQLGDTLVELTVSDGSLSASCTTTVTVENDAPLITPLEETTVFVGGSVQLSVEASDIQDLAYAWDASGCPDVATIVEASTSTPTLTIPAGTSPGFCQVSVEVCDACSECASATGMIVIVDPEAGFVTGGGFIQSPVQAYTDNSDISGKANYGFVSKYKKGALTPSGQTSFIFEEAGLKFMSSSYDWLVVTEAGCAKYKGVGTVNGGAQTYEFILTACDNGEGGGVGDTFRIQIDGVYDNLLDPDDVLSYDGTVIGGGNVQLHRKKVFNLRG